MQSYFQEGIGLLRIKDTVGIWFSSSDTNTVYVKLLGASVTTLKELSWQQPNADITLYKYSGSCVSDDHVRIMLYQEMVQDTNLQNILSVFTNLCKDSEDALRINTFLNDDNIGDESDPILDKLEKRVSKLTSRHDNSIHNQDELFDKLLKCGFKKVSV